MMGGTHCLDGRIQQVQPTIHFFMRQMRTIQGGGRSKEKKRWHRSGFYDRDTLMHPVPVSQAKKGTE